MPRIPDFNVPSVQVQPIQMPEMQGPGVAPMPNAAPQQIQEMGQGMSRFGQGMSDIAMRMQDMVNDSVVAETDNKWRDILNQESVRFQSLQGRDAILLADRINNGGANVTEIWRGFAKRGMGLSAQSPGGDACAGVVEAYDFPLPIL